jgi:hypothetical protein
MAYEFMREFTGVPLRLTRTQRLNGMVSFLTGGLYLLSAYLEHADSVVHRGRRVSVSLNLYHEGGSELLLMDGVASQRGMIDTGIALVGLSGVAKSSHRYAINRQDIVVRQDTPDLEAQQAMDLPYCKEGLNRAIENAQRVRTDDHMPERSAEPVHEVDMSGFRVLTQDAVTPEEIGGLRTYFEQKIDSGLYAPVDQMQALRLQGLLP